MTINKATRSVDLFNTIRGAAVAMMAQTPESPDLQERLRKLQTFLLNISARSRARAFSWNRTR